MTWHCSTSGLSGGYQFRRAIAVYPPPPHLRILTERALSMAQLAWIGGHFSAWSHREFILFSILPVLAATVSGRRGSLAGWQRSMQRVDRALLDALPAAGRPCWETVLVLER